MGKLSWEEACEFLGTADIPGSPQEREVLRIRMGELLELNGEGWIRANREMLLEQWRCVVELKTIP